MRALLAAEEGVQGQEGIVRGQQLTAEQYEVTILQQDAWKRSASIHKMEEPQIT